MNRVCLIGRLTRDPELRTTANGIDQVRFTLAVNRKNLNADGEREADFIICVAWRKLAETISKYIVKGQELAVEGRIQTGSYDAQDGTKRYTFDVVADNITFIGSKQNKEEQQPKKMEYQSTNDYELEQDDIAVLSDDDLPF